MRNIGWIIGVGVLLSALFFYFNQNPALSPFVPEINEETTADTKLVTEATYFCAEGHTIHAVYYQNVAKPETQAGQIPTPSGWVEISLDSGPNTTLVQTVSAGGARYSDGDPQIPPGQPGTETFTFWNKGNTALIMRDNAMDLTYTNCVSE